MATMESESAYRRFDFFEHVVIRLIGNTYDVLSVIHTA